MRNVVVVVLITSVFSFSAAARQGRSSAPAAGSPSVKACSLLTKELALKVSSANKALFDIPPRESPGESGKGSECNYGDITLQIDTFPWSTYEAAMKKGGAPLAGVGDAALFRDNGGRMAELATRVGSHTAFIQMGVPITSTAEKFKPNVVTLANAIVPKLK